MPLPNYSGLMSYTDMLAKRKKLGTGPTAPTPTSMPVNTPTTGIPQPQMQPKQPQMPSVLDQMANPQPATDPISGLPIQPPGTPKQIMTSSIPMPTGTDAPQKQTFQSDVPMPSGSQDIDPISGLPKVAPGTPKTVQTSNVPVPTGIENLAGPNGGQTSLNPTTGAPTGSKTDGLYDSVLDQLASGIKDDKPLPGTAAQIAQNREALATYAKSAEARAGMTAAKTGAIGQGTANQMGQAVRSDILGELAKSELGNTQIVSDEKQKLITAATQAGQFAQNKELEKERIDVQKDQFGKTFEEGKSQFAATMEQRKSEFEKNFGAAEGQAYNNQLERMAQDNPVLATKLTNHLLQGKTGPIGSFSPEEIQQMKDYTAKKQGQDDKLSEVMNQVLASIPGQITASNKAGEEATADAEKAKKVTAAETRMNSLSGSAVLPKEDFDLLQSSGKVVEYATANIPRGANGATEILAKSPKGIISLNGKQAKVVRGYTIGVVDVLEVKNDAGTSYWVDGNGKWYRSAPQKNQRDDNRGIQITAPF